MIRAVLLSLPLSFACIPNDAFVNSNPLVTECQGEPPRSVRVASYNIHSAADSSLAEIGDVIAEIAPDVIGLQEVNVDFKGEDQAKILADRLGYPYVYASALSRGLSHTYGIVLLSRLPLKRADRINLRTAGAAEPRVAIDATVCLGAKDQLRVIATHADVWAPSPNLEELRRRLDPTVTEKTILLGDLNVQPGDGPVEQFQKNGMTDLVGKLTGGPTFWPHGKQLDYLIVDRSLEDRATGAAIGQTHASDHLPIWADFALK
jgi:endonuclease/exonuclease/phosphatase family metal-dependent hydrolase